jgi:CHAD domain-containing protein
MKRKKIKRYLKKRVRYIEKYALVISFCSDPEAIHQLRVGYKKLRAFLRVAKLEASAKKDLAIPSKLREIYKCAGRVRDLQIYYHKIFPFYNKADSYPHLVLHQIAGAKYMLLNALKYFHFGKALKKLEKRVPDRLSGKTLDEFIQKKSKAIDRSIGITIRDARLHALKKYLKDVSFSLKAFHASFRNYKPIAGAMSKGELSKLSGVLNEYLDWVIGLALLNTALAGKLSVHDKTTLHRIRRSWINKKGAVRRHATAMLHS